jgi:Asp-tRNA(Asn)/Glu-tRNA(Gln) amidotransferase A subunit family amidase
VALIDTRFQIEGQSPVEARRTDTVGGRLPVGLTLVGKHFAEETIYQAAAFEGAGDWTKM